LRASEHGESAPPAAAHCISCTPVIPPPEKFVADPIIRRRVSHKHRIRAIALLLVGCARIVSHADPPLAALASVPPSVIWDASGIGVALGSSRGAGEVAKGVTAHGILPPGGVGLAVGGGGGRLLPEARAREAPPPILHTEALEPPHERQPRAVMQGTPSEYGREVVWAEKL